MPSTQTLIRDVVAHHNAAAQDPLTAQHLHHSGLPVAWFGDSKAYFHSKIKVLTVGLNPRSGLDPMWHKGAQSLVTRPLGNSSHNALGVLYDDYFVGNTLVNVTTAAYNAHYLRWFRSLDTKLRGITTSMLKSGQSGLDASYNGCIASGHKKQTANTALHIDLFTTSPTSDVWSVLPKDVKTHYTSGIKPAGLALFLHALQVFQPDYLLFGVGRGYLPDIGLTPIHCWSNKGYRSTTKLSAASQDVNLNTFCGSTGLKSRSRFVWLESQRTPFSLCPDNIAALVF